MTARRRSATGLLAVTAALLAGLLAGCGADEVAASDVCAAPERPPLQEGSHLLGDTPPPVPYSSTPPTSGWHRSGQPPLPGVYGTQLDDADVVAVAERGRVVVAHAGALTPAEDALAATLVAELDGLVVTPYAMDAGDPPIALVAWGVLQRCDVLDGDAVAAFVAAHGGVGPGH